MTRAILIVLTTAALAVPGSGCGSSHPVTFGQGILSIRSSSGAVSLRVEIADSGPERERGLMGRRSLAPDAGMVFLFDRPTDTGFWMKDTLIPLDIAYWASGGRIVAILHMRPCQADPCPLYAPGARYVGAVEANWGYFDRHGVRPGDSVKLARD